jgi:hypothetical protein
MKILNNFAQGSEEWHAWRNGIISSTDAKSLVGTKELLVSELKDELKDQGCEEEDYKKLKKEELQNLILEKKPEFKFTKFITKENDTLYYKLLAYKLSDGTAPEDERAMDRGNRLEPKIREWFNKEYKQNFIEVGGCTRDDNDEIGMSPDGINDKNEGLEIKALSGWKHVKAWQENELPEEHLPQVIQYFVTDDKMEKVFFVMGCPEIKVKPYVVFEMYREDLEKEIETSLQAQRELLEKVNKKHLEINF